MGMLIPTWPTSTSFWNFRAALPERVKMAVPFPYMLALTSAMAASSDSVRSTSNTGPKISCRYASMSGRTLSRTVGPTKLPVSYPGGGNTPRPSSNTLAPWSTPLWMSASIRALAAGEITGPTSTVGSVPGPTLSALALRTMVSRMTLVRSPGPSPPGLSTKTTVDIAMQRCPAAPNAAPTRALAAASGSASGITTAWFLAPMLHCTRLPAADARACMWRPAVSLPTKETARMSG
mmetsp:Transcript_25315/g.63391  ORF Transcript_25315/g.63391 Transcript_25315/m.63391 type:complete len:235 (-) Transcript_25315:962-1666(-)